MFASVAFAALVVTMALVALGAFAGRIAIWRRGRAAQVDWLRGLLATPRRYLVDVHDIVAREARTAQMHAWTAGGLLAGSGMALIGALPGLRDNTTWWGLDELSFAVLLRGAFIEARRRWRLPARLSGGLFQHLPVLLIGYGVGGLGLAVCAMVRASPAAAAAPLTLAGVCGLTLAAYAGRGPMRHALAGALHLAAHPRPARFGRGRSVALAPEDLGAERLGVETLADFAWNRLLGFDACVQCGRCEAACPAFAAGQPLNPKRLIQDFVASPLAYAGSPHPHARPLSGGAPIVGGAIHPDTLWSCTTCRACVEECPMMIEHVDAVIGLRRHQTMTIGAVPDKAAARLDDLRDADEPGGHSLTARADFAAGLELRILAPGETTDVLLWLGEGAYDLRHGRTLRALVRLLHAAGVDFAILGERERDCGDLARRLGDEATFARLARENVETLSSVRFEKILTADPHALNSLRNDYPAFGGAYEVWHHTAFLDALVHDDKLTLGRLEGRATYHDPCYLGRYNGEVGAPRRLLDALGLDRVEMERHGVRSFCCGGGGGAPLADIEGDRRIPDLRMAQARATGAEIVAVACPNCTAMLEGVTGERAEVRDVAELTLAAYEAGAIHREMAL
jgi:Fe-S oxidoreductase